MNLVFLGPPGSGKGTQANMLAEELGFEHLSTGDLLRKEVESKTPTGIRAEIIMKNGGLVDDDLVIEIIKNKVANNKKINFIFDGFPRNINQAEKLDIMLENLGIKIDKVFNFEVEEDVLIKRIAGRFTCQKCNSVYNHYFKPTLTKGVCDKCGSSEFLTRPDDNEITVKNRLEVYIKSSFPLIEYYQKKHLLVSIDALKMAPQIFKELKSGVIN